MTLQTSGQISAQDIIVEENKQIADSFDINSSVSRELAKKTSGQIAFSDFYGKSIVVPGCQGFTTSTVFTIPPYNVQLTVEVWGAGGSGGNSNGDKLPAAAGSYSVAKLNGGWLVGYGGTGGQNTLSSRATGRGWWSGYGGTGGSGSGGDINLTGGNGGTGTPAVPGSGGTSPYGGAGGVGVYPVGGAGGFPGGGGGGTGEGYGQGKFSWDCGGGGAGGYTKKTIAKSSGYAPVFSTATIEIGAPGQGVATYGSEKGGDGGAGYCYICWDMGIPPAAPRDTFLSSYCDGYNLYYTVADGNYGTYNKLVEPNSSTCGYAATYNEAVTAPANVTVNQTYNMTITGGRPNTGVTYTQNGLYPLTFNLDTNGNYTFINTYLNAAGTFTYEFTFDYNGHVRSVTTVAAATVAPAPAPPYTYAIFAAQYGLPLNLVTSIATYYTSNNLYSFTTTEPSVVSGFPDVITTTSYYGLYRKPDVAGLAGWVHNYLNNGYTSLDQMTSDFYGGMIQSGEYYTRGNTPNKAFDTAGTQGDFADPPAGYT